MHRLFRLAFVLGLTMGCSEDVPLNTLPPSPLLAADSDRLWILLRASRMGDGRKCKELYLKPDDSRYQGRTKQCDVWTRNFADYLRHNGFPTIEHRHLKEPVYWQWYLDKRGAISGCRKALGTLTIPSSGMERARHQESRNACDPYDDALNNQDLLPAELGIRYQ